MEEVENTVLEKIEVNSNAMKAWATQFKQKRYLYDKVSKVDAQYYVGVRGLRGVGKTVMMLQMAREMEKSVYFSADAMFLKPHRLYYILDALRKRGFENIFIDEIHAREDWETDVKTAYDEHQIRIFFSGSSALNVHRSAADLSRRALIFELKPTSFREFLNMKKGFNAKPMNWEEVLAQGKKGTDAPYITAFEQIDEYMRTGGMLYPSEGFAQALENSVRKIVSTDLAALRDINIKYENDAYRLLYLIAASQPFEASYSSLSAKLGLTKTFLIRLVSDLQAAGLLKVVLPCTRAKRDIVKEPKIYLAVPFRYFFCPTPLRGSLREEFFVNHVDVEGYFKTMQGEKTPDFLAKGLRIEVGGASKGMEQKPDYAAVDSPLGDEKKIPLHLFGFLY